MNPNCRLMRTWWLRMLDDTFATVIAILLAVAVAGSAVAAGADTHDWDPVAPTGAIADTHGDHNRDDPSSGEHGKGHLLGHCGGPVCWGAPAGNAGVATPARLTKRPARLPRRRLPAGLALVGDPPVPRLR